MELKLGDVKIADVPEDVARKMIEFFRKPAFYADAQVELDGPSVESLAYMGGGHFAQSRSAQPYQFTIRLQGTHELFGTLRSTRHFGGTRDDHAMAAEADNYMRRLER